MMPTAYQQHIEARDLAVERLVALYHNGVDIGDREIFNATLARYGLLKDGFESEEQYIIREVNRRIK